jgi:hypothetical protein
MISPEPRKPTNRTPDKPARGSFRLEVTPTDLGEGADPHRDRHPRIWPAPITAELPRAAPSLPP